MIGGRDEVREVFFFVIIRPDSCTPFHFAAARMSPSRTQSLDRASARREEENVGFVDDSVRT